MARKPGELVPIGDALAGLDGPVKSIREASPQALHHFTRFDQVNQLVSASEADPDLGFMARTMALCSLPRSNPGNRKAARSTASSACTRTRPAIRKPFKTSASRCCAS